MIYFTKKDTKTVSLTGARENIPRLIFVFDRLKNLQKKVNTRVRLFLFFTKDLNQSFNLKLFYQFFQREIFKTKCQT